MIARPAGRYDADLRVTFCDDRAYMQAVVSNLAATIDPATKEFCDADPAPVGDCIISKRTWYTGPQGQDEMRYTVKLGECWTKFDDQESAIAFVRQVRAIHEPDYEGEEA